LAIPGFRSWFPARCVRSHNIVICDAPHLEECNKLYQQQYGGYFQPRFPPQGVIAIKPDQLARYDLGC